MVMSRCRKRRTFNSFAIGEPSQGTECRRAMGRKKILRSEKRKSYQHLREEKISTILNLCLHTREVEGAAFSESICEGEGEKSLTLRPHKDKHFITPQGGKRGNHYDPKRREEGERSTTQRRRRKQKSVRIIGLSQTT